MGSVYFHYVKIVGVEIINTILASSVVLKGLYFIMPFYDFCEKQHKVGIKLMCPFVEKLLKFKKVCGSGPKSAQKNCPVMPQCYSKNVKSYKSRAKCITSTAIYHQRCSSAQSEQYRLIFNF